MSLPTTFQVYAASAGSGKTFTLVKEYLKILLKNNDIFHFQKVLAITFTNKAATEMKERVIDNLQCFARGYYSDMLQALAQETGLDTENIQVKSHRIIEAILRDYSGFNITTIDSFTHRIIRSFAYDFGLSMDFDIEMDIQKLLQEAVDAVIAQIGIDKELTKALITFSLQKSDDDKSWDITNTLTQFASILANESDTAAFKEISDKSFTDYTVLQKQLYKQLAELEIEMQKIGNTGVTILHTNNLQDDFFSYKMLPNFFNSLAKKKDISRTIQDGKLLKRFEDKTLFKKTVDQVSQATFENYYYEFYDLYLKTEQLSSKVNLLKLFKESIIPLSVLSYIHKALEEIKSTNNIRLLAEFNEMIFSKIQNEPTPFIYERLGEKYQHFFIDEMQDTSILQWKNLAKLIENPLSQEEGSLLLVGDAKQAIYRWRGGESEQFIDLSDPKKQEPFQLPKKVADLYTNYRSYTEIIKFNNSFFQHISGLLQNRTYQDLYKNGNQQKTTSKIGGYVQIDFLRKEKDDPEVDLLYPKKVLETIQNLDKNFEWKDVCVLVRKNKEGVAIASFLNENGIAIISSESLLLASDNKVNFLINLLQSLVQITDKKSRLSLLGFLYNHADIKTDKHSFFSELVHLDETDFYRKLKAYQIDFQLATFHQKSLYDAVEYSIRTFKLTNSSDAYLQYFLDVILEFQTQKGSDIIGFLDFWELKKEKLSISMPEGKNAVQIMTIHKAKGLQFSVVIYPHDLDIYKQINPKVWYPIEYPDSYNGFKKMLIPFRSSLQHTDDIGTQLYQERREMLELDNYNLLYVVLTRAIEQLYIITDYKIDKKGHENTNFYSGLFIHYLKENNHWNSEQLSYTFGNKVKVLHEEKETSDCKKTSIETITSTQFISTDITDHLVSIYSKSSLLWDTEQGEAIAYGNLLHEILAQIKTQDDIEIALQSFLNQGIINDSEINEIHNKIIAVVTHPELTNYFQQNVTIYCEREILTSEGAIIIPDRLIIFPDKEAVILDYKTGAIEPKHKTQIQHYAAVVAEMGYKVTKTLLVYIGDVVKIIG
jgi:ATP-dependent exoDNAse (exonuclease V) beta subunit